MHRSLTTAVAALALGVAATPALAAETGAQQTVAKAGQKAPVTVGGTGLKKGSTLKSGQTMIKRITILDGREKASVTLTCAEGSALQGLASQDAGTFTWVVASKKSYVGKRSTKVNLFGKRKAGEDTHAAMYAVCGKA